MFPRVLTAAAAALALAAPLPGCRPSARAPDSAPAGAVRAPDRETAVAAASGERPPDASRRGSPCVVARVVDGDTFNCTDGRKVRVIGVDAPELRQRPFGQRARQALARLAPVGDTVLLEADVTPRDRYGRTLAHPWRGDTLVGEALVRRGYALLYTVPPDVRYAERFESAQRRARSERAGLWADDGFACAPRDARRGRCRRRVRSRK
jgi:micrococcal nuclease